MSSRDRTTPTPQLALRVAAFGIIAFGVFAVLFLRLWFLQVLQGDQYVAQANENRARIVRVAAPRGTIVDRNSKDGSGTLVDNKLSTIVTLQADAVPRQDVTTINEWGQKRGRYEAQVDDLVDELMAPTTSGQRRRYARETEAQTDRRRRVVTRDAEARLESRKVPDLRVSRDASPLLRSRLQAVSSLLDSSTRVLYERVVSSVVQLPYAGVPLKTQRVSSSVRNFILENPQKYPGITVTKEYLRQYPAKQLSSQLFGQVGEIGDDELKDPRYRGLVQGQRIGKSGLEYEYDSFLRGKDGEQRIEVNAANQPTGRVTETAPTSGDRLRLTLDAELDKTAQFGLRRQIGTRVDDKTNKRAGGAVVAMDPRNGEILAMDSYPSVDPGVFNRISPSKLRRLTGAKNGSPLFNRAVAAAYPAASTFKLVTATAGLASGTIGLNTVQGSGSCVTLGANDQKFCNAGDVDHGAQNVTDALTVSSDTFFYLIGWNLFVKPDAPLQRWARLLGFQRKTGIDLPSENAGVVPDSAWRKGRDKAELDCRKEEKKASCGLVAQIGDTYKRGDNVNLAVGQGDLQITPLQLANAYAGFYDPQGQVREGLNFPTPHLAMQVETPNGVLQQRFKPKAPRRVQFPAEFKAAIKKGLAGVTVSGTAASIFTGWDQGAYPVFGKTGTAERCDSSTGTACRDQGWFVAMVQDPERPIVVVATVEDGGFGSDSAAPIVCKMLRKWYDQPPSQVPCQANTNASKID
ncbi:penicillin-binding transpeptidase domain-containing protein [Patulibacter sp.]|uniref:penicillin-binding transpeptidase domain-containing protein n=1 Tax=Patulibacter sp. TaxID=1912859 RepID=UPI002721F310|nr:penicillin-binding transpeptidase domain-containing protein [Patulibacter sp.]MDO9408429.1 penicillin-binding transpeptidase domain-containing protein [Patulibacter sp.]